MKPDFVSSRNILEALYHGRYYLYFGATPAVLLFALWRLITGHARSTCFVLTSTPANSWSIPLLSSKLTSAATLPVIRRTPGVSENNSNPNRSDFAERVLREAS